MVTEFENHWDRIPNDKTSYPMFMIPGEGKQPEKIIENTQTIFIKKNKQTKIVEEAWEGFVNNFTFKTGKIYFKVNINKKILPIPEYSNYENGWHIYESEMKPVEPEYPDQLSIYPPFFDVLKTTGDWKEFEELTFLLLKLLGVHDIYPYKEQSGTADGFFIFKKLAVLYDCTLRNDFEKIKEEQIDNYSAKLKSGTIKYQDCVKTFSNHDKQVWIITRGSSRTIRNVDGVLIKEVTVDKIIQIYQNRLKDNIDEKILENQLINI